MTGLLLLLVGALIATGLATGLAVRNAARRKREGHAHPKYWLW
jgi:hypothetical protein